MPLSKDQFAEFERALKQEQAALLKPIDTTELVTEKHSDEADIASLDVDQTIHQRLNARNLLYLKKVNEALAKISKGTYGECEGCGEDISVKRLQARLTAVLCIGCKEDQEKYEKALKQSGGAMSWESSEK